MRKLFVFVLAAALTFALTLTEVEAKDKANRKMAEGKVKVEKDDSGEVTAVSVLIVDGEPVALEIDDLVTEQVVPKDGEDIKVMGMETDDGKVKVKRVLPAKGKGGGKKGRKKAAEDDGGGEE